MDSIHGISDAYRVLRTPQDQRQKRQDGRDFAQEFEQQNEDTENSDPTVRKPDAARRKHLQIEPEQRRKTPSDGEFHIDVPLESARMARRIPRDRVVEVTKPALVASGAEPDSQSMTVIPLVDGDTIAGLEIRCRCGSRAVVDCIYEPITEGEATS